MGRMAWFQSRKQIGVQAVAVITAIVFSGGMTLLIIWGLNKFVKFRSAEEDEMAGLDRTFHGERAYGMLNPS